MTSCIRNIRYTRVFTFSGSFGASFEFEIYRQQKTEYRSFIQIQIHEICRKT